VVHLFALNASPEATYSNELPPVGPSTAATPASLSPGPIRRTPETTYRGSVACRGLVAAPYRALKQSDWYEGETGRGRSRKRSSLIKPKHRRVSPASRRMLLQFRGWLAPDSAV
jgi:hypothetical protein